MKEAAFIMREYGIQDPFDMTPAKWNKLFECAAEEVA